jgi:hypothetical protein
MVCKMHEGRGRRTKIVLTILASAIGALALWGTPVVAAATPSWYYNNAQLHEAVNAEWQGTLVIKVGTVGPTVECETTAKGTLGPLGNSNEKKLHRLT